MKKENNKTKTKANKSNPTKYSYEQLFTSSKFNKVYQRDLAKVVLGDKLYTVEDAIHILNTYFSIKK